MARILSPLAFFLAYVVYLAVWSRDPFLKRWLDGSFAFFIALVLANLIRARIVASGRAEDASAQSGESGDGSERSRDGNG
jgi:hypothetical protein